VPVGFPLDDMEILVVDDDGREVERQCLGEIAIKSRYLALAIGANLNSPRQSLSAIRATLPSVFISPEF
jgi:hypothetical protein